MIQRSISNKKNSPLKPNHNRSLKIEEPLLKERWDQAYNRSKGDLSNRSKKDLSLSKSKGKYKNSLKQNKDEIQREFTKQTYKRVQQKLNICTRIQQLITEIKQRQAKLTSFFEIYRILQSEIGQQRCLQHNNDLSLYCQTQNKVLCVHCIYGASKHKTHKVIPLKDCIEDISKDVINLQSNIERDLDTIRIKVRTAQMNESFIERHYRSQLQQLENKYNQKLHDLQTDFCDKKAYLDKYFTGIIKKNSQLTNSLKNFEKSIHVKLSNLRFNQNFSRHVVDMKLISKQTIMSKISELSNIKGLSIEDINEKDLGQNCLRSRIHTDKR